MEPSDAELIYEWENIPETWETGDRRWPVSLHDVRQLIAHSDLDIWQTRQMRNMIDDAQGRTIGCADIYDFDPLNGHCSVGIYIAKEFRRCGHAACAIGSIEKFAFETLGVKSIKATVEASNAASAALFRSCGYTEVGRLEAWVRHGSHYSDEIIFQKVR